MSGGGHTLRDEALTDDGATLTRDSKRVSKSSNHAVHVTHATVLSPSTMTGACERTLASADQTLLYSPHLAQRVDILQALRSRLGVTVPDFDAVGHVELLQETFTVSIRDLRSKDVARTSRTQTASRCQTSGHIGPKLEVLTNSLASRLVQVVNDEFRLGCHDGRALSKMDWSEVAGDLDRQSTIAEFFLVGILRLGRDQSLAAGIERYLI